MSQKRIPLVVIVTRTRADLGSDSDEFVGEWGGTVSERHKVFTLPAPLGVLLVLHGCREYGPDLPAYIREQKRVSLLGQQEGAAFEPCCLFFHGDEGAREVSAALKTICNRANFEMATYSSSGEGLAVTGLAVAFSRIQQLQKLENKDLLFRAIMDAATGPQAFDGALLELQNRLLQIWLWICVLQSPRRSQDPEITDQTLKSAVRSAMEVAAIANRGCVRKARLRLQPIERDPIDRALRFLAFLRGDVDARKQADLRPSEFWGVFPAEKAFNDLPKIAASMQSLQESFRLLARAIDTLRGVGALATRKEAPRK